MGGFSISTDDWPDSVIGGGYMMTIFTSDWKQPVSMSIRINLMPMFGEDCLINPFSRYKRGKPFFQRWMRSGMRLASGRRLLT